jgi:hypothetical protein
VDELHGVLFFLIGLLEEELGEQGQVLLLKKASDAQVLHTGPKFVADLGVHGILQLFAD